MEINGHRDHASRDTTCRACRRPIAVRERTVHLTAAGSTLAATLCEPCWEAQSAQATAQGNTITTTGV